MSRVISAAGLLAALLWTSTADAVSVTNRDDREVKLTVIEGEAKQDHILKPSQELKEVCQKGCVIRLNDSENDEYELEGSEVVSIEEGYLYYDGPDASAEPSPGAAGQPSEPGQK
jgi:hypothetical protein